jgi:transcriptional regulator with XRE-family HTH domain
MLIGETVQSYREKHNLSLRDLAKTIGVGPTILFHFERGRGLSDRNWCKVMVWLLREDEITPKEEA